MKTTTPRKLTLISALSAALLGATSLPLQAFEFSSGEWSGNLDTTISYGASWRVDDYDPSLVGKQANNPLVFTLDKLAQRDVIGRWKRAYPTFFRIRPIPANSVCGRATCWLHSSSSRP